MTPAESLIHSAKRGNVESIKELLSQGVSPHVTNTHGSTLLDIALKSCHTKTIELLLSIEGLYFTKRPWEDVARCSNGKVLKMLLEKDIPHSNVALFIAARQSHLLHFIRIFLRSGVDQSILNTVLKIAIEQGYDSRAVEMLLKAGANPYTTYRRWAKSLLRQSRNERLRAIYLARCYFGKGTEVAVSATRQSLVIREIKKVCPDVFHELLGFFHMWNPVEQVSCLKVS